MTAFGGRSSAQTVLDDELGQYEYGVLVGEDGHQLTGGFPWDESSFWMGAAAGTIMLRHSDSLSAHTALVYHHSRLIVNNTGTQSAPAPTAAERHVDTCERTRGYALAHCPVLE